MQKLKLLSDLELSVMQILWNHEQPMTILEISDAYNKHHVGNKNMNNIVTRLARKGYIQYIREILVVKRRVKTYSPIIPAEEYFVYLIKRGLEGSDDSSKVIEGIFLKLIYDDTLYNDDFDALYNALCNRIGDK